MNNDCNQTETFIQNAPSSPAELPPIPEEMENISNILIFFFAMVLHEIVLEMVSKSFSGFDALAESVTLFQFGFSFGLPFLLSRQTVYRSQIHTADNTICQIIHLGLWSYRFGYTIPQICLLSDQGSV